MNFEKQNVSCMPYGFSVVPEIGIILLFCTEHSEYYCIFRLRYMISYSIETGVETFVVTKTYSIVDSISCKTQFLKSTRTTTTFLLQMKSYIFDNCIAFFE